MRYGKIVTAIAIMFAIMATCGAADEAADIDNWVEQLGSEDFDTREKAATELGKRAEKIWDKLEKLSKSDRPDVRTLARRAMGEAGKRTLKKMIDDMNAEIAAQEKLLQDAVAALNPLEAEIKKAESAELKAIEKRIILPNDGTRAREAAATKTKEEAVARWRVASEELMAKQKSWRLEQAARVSRIDQLKYLLESGEIVLPSELADWKPDKLPFDKKLKCCVSFEFVDMPLADALKQFKAMCGLTVELDPAVVDAPSINLRVNAMSADISLEWICKLADLEHSVDIEGKKIIVHKAKK